jgi:signal peptidase
MEESKREKKESSSIGHKILTVIGVILCVILIPILIINITLIIRSYTNSDEVPSIGGVSPMIVLTDSMYPTIKSGDLVICNTAKAKDVKEGDIMSFFDPAGNGSTVVTHRVVEVITNEDGSLSFRTRGDANNADDSELVPEKNVIGIYWKKIPGAGNVAMFMQTTQGLIICVICPIVVLVTYDIIRRRLYEKQQKKDTDELLSELEELRKAKSESDNKEEGNSGI